MFGHTRELARPIIMNYGCHMAMNMVGWDFQFRVILETHETFTL